MVKGLIYFFNNLFLYINLQNLFILQNFKVFKIKCYRIKEKIGNLIKNKDFNSLYLIDNIIDKMKIILINIVNIINIY